MTKDEEISRLKLQITRLTIENLYLNTLLKDQGESIEDISDRRKNEAIDDLLSDFGNNAQSERNDWRN